MITSYKELTISKYLEILDILKDNLEPLELQCELLSVLTDMDYDSIMRLSLPEYQKLVEGTAFLMEKPKLTGHIPAKIRIGGKAYTITKDVTKINVAQYVDYQMYSKQEDKEKSIPQILSCFIIPEGCKYGEGYDVLETIKEISNNMSIEDAVNVCFFFQKRYRTLIEGMLIYLELKVKRLKRKVKGEKAKTMMTESLEKIQVLRSLL